MNAGSWSSVIEPNLRENAVRVALDVGRRVCGPDRIEAAVREMQRQSEAAPRPPWVPHALMTGLAGLALLHGQLDQCFPGEGWGDAAQNALEGAVKGAERAGHMELGLGTGLSGLGLAAQQLATARGGYEALLQSLDEFVALGQRDRVKALHGARNGFAAPVFDAISGLSGVVRYWLARRAHGVDDRPLHEAVGALVTLANTDGEAPRWHTPRALAVDGAMADLFPGGYLDCGLAHGVAGPLAVLSLAKLHGVEVDGLAAAIAHLAAWLVSNRCDDAWGMNWPSGVALEKNEGAVARPAATRPATQAARAGWCYGSPGVARALYLAGRALGRPGLCTAGAQSLDAALARPPRARRLSSQNLCHGQAGLLQIALRFQNDAPQDTRLPAIRELTASILAHHAPDSMLGYTDTEPQGGKVDEPALLTGAPGIALALLAAACDVEPAWDGALLLS